jgi:hypothetical protein
MVRLQLVVIASFKVSISSIVLRVTVSMVAVRVMARIKVSTILPLQLSL